MDGCGYDSCRLVWRGWGAWPRDSSFCHKAQGGSEDELTGVMVQISQVVAKQFSDRK